MQLLRLIEMALICKNICLGWRNNDIVDGTENLSEPGKQLDNHQGNNTASLNKTRLEWKFVGKNIINLSKRNLSRSEISLLSKGLKFAPSANEIDRAKLKREMEEYGRKLRLMWHFRNNERTFSTDLSLFLIRGIKTL